ALPLERASLAWAKLSPVGGARWARLRMLGVSLAGAVTLVVAVAIVSIVFGLQGSAALDVAAFAVATTAVAAGTGFLAGAVLGDPAWVDPRAMLGTGGRTVTALALLAESAAWLAISHRSPAAAFPPAALCGIVLTGLLAAFLLVALAARVIERPEGLRPRG